MQSRDSFQITAAEWRWVIAFGILLVILAFVPFFWVALSSVAGTQWQFMGVLNNYRDGATYLAKMQQGFEGSWLVYFWHTPEPHSGAFIQVIYPALGQLARLIDLSPIAMFHAARVVASFMMYMALYQLGASIWVRLRTRRLFFLLVAVGSGLGWLFYPLFPTEIFPDLTIPEMYPLYSSLVNVHFPLTIACLALLAAVIVMAFRPGADEDPSVKNGGLLAGLLSFMVSLLYPQALLPLGAAIGIFVGVGWLRKRRVSARGLRWLLVIALPAVPMAAYYFAVVTYNPTLHEWTRQNVTLAPPPLVLALGLGVPLALALPGIYRAVRRFEPDGDQFMLIWLVVLLVMIYLPTTIQRRFAAGMMLPVAYFATRSLEDFWFTHINQRWHYRLLAILSPVLILSYIMLLVVNLQFNVGPFLNRDYAGALQWLHDRTQTSDVILAAEEVSIWVPAWAGARAVYGHPYETLDAATKEREVTAWFSGQDTDCPALLNKYHVRYVIYGPLERELGQPTCLDTLRPVAQSGSVIVYAAY
ncbi:MAG TPA: hypothetical protein VHO69_11465 [Phototrophicaceae bacterium]|nr:hypothetical protein [Phototrophicaceae bacterium]